MTFYMKVTLIGYGKMGRAIERFLLERGHEVVCTIDAGEEHKFDSREFATSDVAIEFTRPDAAVANYRRAFAAGVPVVSGTTGWTKEMETVRHLISQEGATLLWTSNFSIGVNVSMRVNSYLAQLMSKFPQYRPSMKEIHHIHKLDHPSGTAISLAEGITHSNPKFTQWQESEVFAPADAEGVVAIAHERSGEVPGTHIVRWTSPVDEITLEHRAFSRDGFALGAVLAAEWVVAHPERSGLLSMADFLGF